MKMKAISAAILGLCMSASASAAVDLIATGSLSGSLFDMSGQSGLLENGVRGDLFGGVGSGLTWAGGNTFLALPDRGPNATSWNTAVDNTTSYIPRFQTITLDLAPAAAGSALPYTLTPTLTGTTLLYSTTPLNYAAASATNNNIAGTPALNTATQNYFSGRSDNFIAGSSLNSNNARFDPEGIRMSNDGKYVYLSDEYGPYVYQFDRFTGARTKVFTLPSKLAVSNLSAVGDNEISGNTAGRIANKGMEGLAISPDGTTLYGFMQSPLIQDSSSSGAGKGSMNRIIKIDIASGTTKEFAYNNTVGTKTYNSSEMLALNDHQFLVLERDGSGLNNADSTAFKQLRFVDLSNAADVTDLKGQSTLSQLAAQTSLFLDIVKVLNNHGIASDKIPAKLEGMAFGKDFVGADGKAYHTLYIGNDNDFQATSVMKDGSSADNPNRWYVFSFTDADLTAVSANASFVNQQIAAVPEPESYAMMLAGLALLGAVARRKKNAA